MRAHQQMCSPPQGAAGARDGCLRQRARPCCVSWSRAPVWCVREQRAVLPGCAAALLRCCAAPCAHSALRGCSSACMLHAPSETLLCRLHCARGCLSMLLRRWRPCVGRCAHCARLLAAARRLRHRQRAWTGADRPRAGLRRLSLASGTRQPRAPAGRRLAAARAVIVRLLPSPLPPPQSWCGCCCVCRSPAIVAAAAAGLLCCPPDQRGSSRARCRVVLVWPCATAAVGCGGARA